MEGLVEKHSWEKINKKLPKLDSQEKTDLAIACGKCFDEDSSYTLINLLTDSDMNVVMQAVKSLGDIGHDNAKTHLQMLLGRLPDSNGENGTIIKDAIAKINKAHRR